jgi:hypothetical protein
LTGSFGMAFVVSHAAERKKPCSIAKTEAVHTLRPVLQLRNSCIHIGKERINLTGRLVRWACRFFHIILAQWIR